MVQVIYKEESPNIPLHVSHVAKMPISQYDASPQPEPYVSRSIKPRSVKMEFPYCHTCDHSHL